MSVPKQMQGTYDKIAALLIDFSKEHLNDEYEALCLHALEKLCRKRPSPLASGRANSWAAGIVYSIGKNNFIFDRSQKIHLSGKEIGEGFGVAASTAAAKAAEIQKALKIRMYDAEWCLPSMVKDNPMIWIVSVNGLAVDARHLPLEYQVACYEKGLIPYIPALREEKAASDADNDASKDEKNE